MHNCVCVWLWACIHWHMNITTCREFLRDIWKTYKWMFLCRCNDKWIYLFCNMSEISYEKIWISLILITFFRVIEITVAFNEISHRNFSYTVICSIFNRCRYSPQCWWESKIPYILPNNFSLIEYWLFYSVDTFDRVYYGHGDSHKARK